MQPRAFCHVPSTFGSPAARSRLWNPPTSISRIDEFRAAVYQHAVAIHVRRYKNSNGLSQDDLGRLDSRPDSTNKWNARLNGRSGMTMRDLATIQLVLPGAMPDEAWFRTLLGIAEHKDQPPPGWTEVDS